MKRAKIIHNPGAGKEEHSKEKLVEALESKGFEYSYVSTKSEDWEKPDKEADFLVIAGGDGTVRKVVVDLLDHQKEHLPVALFPLGTANNISKALGISGNPGDILAHLDEEKLKPYDIGRVKGLDDEQLFVESFGYGIFPSLMRRMKDHPVEDSVSPQKKLNVALSVLHDIIMTFPAQVFQIGIDGRQHTGSYLLAEVMNINSIGPNLSLSPKGDPGDGRFEVILVPEMMRLAFANYVSAKLAGFENDFTPVILSGENITISTNCVELHVDDELLQVKRPKRVNVRLEKAYMEFLVG